MQSVFSVSIPLCRAHRREHNDSYINKPSTPVTVAILYIGSRYIRYHRLESYKNLHLLRGAADTKYLNKNGQQLLIKFKTLYTLVLRERGFRFKICLAEISMKSHLKKLFFENDIFKMGAISINTLFCDN